MPDADTTTFIRDTRAALAPLADPRRAVDMRAYMRDRFDFLGIQTPARRSAAAPLIRALSTVDAGGLIARAEALWALPQREFQYVAVDLLRRHAARLSARDVPALLALAREKSWWDSVDGLAAVVGDILHAACSGGAGDPQRRMDSAIRHRDPWVRRIAMLHQLGWRADTDTARLFGYAEILAGEEDFFIRKAIGWALRDYARHDPRAVATFLRKHRAELSALTVREAARHIAID